MMKLISGIVGVLSESSMGEMRGTYHTYVRGWMPFYMTPEHLPLHHVIRPFVSLQEQTVITLSNITCQLIKVI